MMAHVAGYFKEQGGAEDEEGSGGGEGAWPEVCAATEVCIVMLGGLLGWGSGVVEMGEIDYASTRK